MVLVIRFFCLDERRSIYSLRTDWQISVKSQGIVLELFSQLLDDTYLGVDLVLQVVHVVAVLGVIGHYGIHGGVEGLYVVICSHGAIVGSVKLGVHGKVASAVLQSR